MFKNIDLHSHSTASDGTLSPADLVRRASTAGVECLALTDHDTTEGLDEAVAEASSSRITLVPGVEVSVTWNAQVVHVVGLEIDAASEALQAGLRGLREFRMWRAEEIGRRLERSGIPGAYPRAAELSSGRLISRTHFARFLVEQGHADSVHKVFRRYLTRGKPGHVPGRWAALEEAVEWIRGAGGLAVIAHPARYPMTRSKLRRLIGEFREVGGAALEVVSGSHSRDDIFVMAHHARDFHLAGSVGSDYHGPENPWVELGNLSCLPDGVVPIWQSFTHNRLAETA